MLSGVSVIGPDLGIADALATAVFAAGLSDAGWLNRFPDYDLIAVTTDRRVLRSPPHPSRPPRTTSSTTGTLGPGSAKPFRGTMEVSTGRTPTNALVVYESLYGNTQLIAEAVAEGLAGAFTTDVLEVGVAPADPSESDLLLVGGPTHQFGLSRKSSRQQGADDSEQPVISLDVGIREWIGSLPRVSGAPAATFDTSIRKPNLPGSAARGAAKRLKKIGYRLLVPGEIFLVEGGKGPITDGELDRAREWGHAVALKALPNE